MIELKQQFRKKCLKFFSVYKSNILQETFCGRKLENRKNAEMYST